MLDAALRAAEVQAGQGHAALVVSGAGWHPGVVGIVAGRIKERFNRPACVAGMADDLAKGSGRSVAGHRPGRRGDRGAPGRHPDRPAAAIRWRRGSRWRRRGWRSSTPS